MGERKSGRERQREREYLIYRTSLSVVHLHGAMDMATCYIPDIDCNLLDNCSLLLYQQCLSMAGNVCQDMFGYCLDIFVVDDTCRFKRFESSLCAP